MKAITLTQPWASLCVALPRPGDLYAVKSIETRSWRLRGEQLPLRVAIHAALSIDPDLRSAITRRRESSTPPFRVFEHPYAGALTLAHLPISDPWERASRVGALPLGAVVGCATIVRIERTEACADKVRRLFPLTYQLGNFSPGRWAWMLERAVELTTPIYARGKQGVWTLPESVRAQLETLDPHYWESER